MKKKLLTVFCALLLIKAAAQQPVSCASSLDTLYDLLKRTPSFKEQMKGSNRDQYAQLYARLRQQATGITDPFTCFLLQSELVLPLNDNHLFFYQRPVLEFKYAQLSDSTFLQQLRQTPWYRDFPRVSISLDSLKEVLANKSADSLEGIYWYNNLVQVGVYRTQRADSLLGVVLSSKMPHWEPGQLAFMLREVNKFRLRAWHAQLLTKNFMLYRNERFENAGLTQTNWKKDPQRKDFVNIPFSEPRFSLRSLTNGIQYLRLGSFATSGKSLQTSEAFYDSIENALTSKILVVDLRNNGGGGFKASMKFLKLLKKYLKTGKIYALINNGTFSNAEQFSILLKREKHVLMLGQTTNGTLTYGNNYGNTYNLAGGLTALYPTDMKDDGNFLPYEDAGLQPDIVLKAGSNWIEQVLEFIRVNEVALIR